MKTKPLYNYAFIIASIIVVIALYYGIHCKLIQVRGDGKMQSLDHFQDTLFTNQVYIEGNPSSGIITFTFERLEENGCQVDVYDANDQLIRTFNFYHTLDQCEVNVTDFHAGSYLLKIRTANQQTTEKIAIR